MTKRGRYRPFQVPITLGYVVLVTFIACVVVAVLIVTAGLARLQRPVPRMRPVEVG